MKKRFIFITARRKELRGGNMKKRRLMLCSLVSLIMVFVMAVPMTVSAAEVTVTTADQLKAEVAKGGDITLGADIEASIEIPKGVTVTLDLNGKKLTNEAKKDTITNNGTLTVKGNGTVDNVSHGKGALVNKGTATINGGTFTRSQEASKSPTDDGGNSWYVIRNQGTLTVNDGTVTNNSRFSSLVRNDGTMNINGGTFTNIFNTIKNDATGTMIISAGTITSDDQAVQNWSKLSVTGGIFNGEVYTWSYDEQGEQFAGETSIDGVAVVNGDVAAIRFGDATTSKPTVEIKGGTVNGTVKKGEYGAAYVVVDPSAQSSDITVSGGTFAKEPASAFIPKDKIAIKYVEANSDGKYYVGTNEEIQEIANTAKDGDTIDVIKGSITLDKIKPGVTVNNAESNEKGEVRVNGTTLEPGTGMKIQNPATDPTNPSQDQTQKPSDTAKADKSAKTGDDFNLFAVGGVALAAIIAMAAVAITGRRHRQR